MSADTLRKAAALMRERAEAAVSGPWEFRPRRGFQSAGHDPATIGFVDAAGYFVMLREGTWTTENDMAYVASWQPAVALAVSESIDTALGWFDPDEHTEAEKALHDALLAVATAYLGDDA